MAYYFVDWYGEKLVVDWNRKVAYWFDERIDEAARDGRIRLAVIPRMNALDFVKDRELAYLTRAPTPEELAF